MTGWIVATLTALLLAGFIWANGTLYGQVIAYQRELQMVKSEYVVKSDQRYALAVRCQR